MNIDVDKLLVALQRLLSDSAAEGVATMVMSEAYTKDDVVNYLIWVSRRYDDEDDGLGAWLESLEPRVTIGFCVTEMGEPYGGTLEFPKRGEDMEHGSEYEWYYSLREETDKIMALKVGESIPFKIRDDKDSVGSVTRLK